MLAKPATSTLRTTSALTIIPIIDPLKPSLQAFPAEPNKSFETVEEIVLNRL